MQNGYGMETERILEYTLVNGFYGTLVCLMFVQAWMLNIPFFLYSSVLAKIQSPLPISYSVNNVKEKLIIKIYVSGSKTFKTCLSFPWQLYINLSGVLIKLKVES